MDWDKLKIFHAVAEAGSFTSATVILNLSQSAISRQIQSLEDDLKVKLFERHARGLTLTENGEYVYKTAHEVISKLKEVETTLGDKKDKPSGKLTVTTVVSFGTTWLTPRIQEFMDLNPEIEVELIFDDKELDLSTREADVAIRMRRPKQLNLIQKKFVDFNYHIYGSNDYLQKNGYPKTSTDLDNHKIISYGEDAQPPLDRHRLNWLLTIGKENKRPRKPILEVSSIYGIAKATEVGMGIASLPDWMEFEMIELTEILSQLEGPEMSISLCFNYELRNDSRIKAFKDFMIKEAEIIN